MYLTKTWKDESKWINALDNRLTFFFVTCDSLHIKCFNISFRRHRKTLECKRAYLRTGWTGTLHGLNGDSCNFLKNLLNCKTVWSTSFKKKKISICFIVFHSFQAISPTCPFCDPIRCCIWRFCHVIVSIGNFCSTWPRTSWLQEAIKMCVGFFSYFGGEMLV